MNNEHDYEINSNALIKNLEDSVIKLKKGATLEESLNEANLLFARMHQDKRDQVRSKLVPPPSRKWEKMLDRIVMKYGNKH